MDKQQNGWKKNAISKGTSMVKMNLRSKKDGISKMKTPLKINMENNHGGVVQIIFLSKWVICRFHVNLPG